MVQYLTQRPRNMCGAFRSSNFRVAVRQDGLFRAYYDGLEWEERWWPQSLLQTAPSGSLARA